MNKLKIDLLDSIYSWDLVLSTRPNENDLTCLLELSETLKTGNANQETILNLFGRLNRKWQGIAMQMVWEARNKPHQFEYGRTIITKSLHCLLEKVDNTSNSPLIIDALIQKMQQELGQEKTSANETIDLNIPSILESLTHLSTLEKLKWAHELLWKAEYSGEDCTLTTEDSSIPFQRITHLTVDVPHYLRNDLGVIALKILDKEILCYLNDPWLFLKNTYFPENEIVSKKQIQEAAKRFFSDKNFNVLHYTVIEHSELSGWVLKGNSSQISCITAGNLKTGPNQFDYLNRVRMAQILKQTVEKEQLLLGFPEIHLIDTQVESGDLEKRYIVVQEKLPIFHKNQLIAHLLQLPYDTQLLYAEHLCRLIIKTGYCDIRYDNMTIKEGKLYLINEEPMGVLWDSDDLHPFYTLSLRECSIIGLQNIIDNLGYDLPVFQMVARRTLNALLERSIDSPQHRETFSNFIAVMQNPLASDKERIEKFEQLDLQFQSFLSFVVEISSSPGNDIVWDGNSNEGKKRIHNQPQILNYISSYTGINILRQINTRFEIQKGIEVLSALKKVLQRDNPSPKTINFLREELKRLLVPADIFAPLLKHIFKTFEKIEKEVIQDDDLAYKKFCHQLLHARIPGSKQCLLDDWIGMLHIIKHDYDLDTIKWKLVSAYHASYGRILANPTPAHPLQDMHISASRLQEPPASKKLNVLAIAYECTRRGLKCGGLGEAVDGMANGLLNHGHQVTIVLPKFNHLPQPVKDRMQPIETITFPYNHHPKKDRVLGFEESGISYRYLEDTPQDSEAVDHYAVPSAHQIYEDGVLKDEREPWFGLKERMAYFSSAAAEYIVSHAQDYDVVVLHDWHAAYAIYQIAHRYFNQWSTGKTPTTVFVIHNNNYGCQGVYSDFAAEIPALFGDPRPGMNVMQDAAELADHVVTVSPTFSVEIQQRPLGSGIDPWMRRHSHQDKITGIINGSNPDLWNPEDNPALKNWKDPLTGEPVPLNFGPNDMDILEKKKKIKEQLQKALEFYYPQEVQKYRLNVKDKDLIAYVGRYDSSQKGPDKFIEMLKAAHQRDAAFVTMGIGEDLTATKHLDALEKEAEKLGNAWITRGIDNASIKMQCGHGNVPALGPLIRAAAIYLVAPSSFEPCGLVQFEAWLFGSLIIATGTGGLKDTIHSDYNSDQFNGFTFERLPEWNSTEQNELVFQTTLKAIDYFRELPDEKKIALLQKVMRNAKLCSWTTAPNGLSPIAQYERVFNAAIDATEKKRGIRTIDIGGYDAPTTVEKDHYFGKGRKEKLYEVFGAHPVRKENEIIGVNFRVMAPGAISVTAVIIDGYKENCYPMKSLEDGSWEIFVEGLSTGAIYEYEIVDKTSFATRKADPFAFRSEMRPKHGSIVADYTQFEWTDGEWLKAREVNQAEEHPLNIYELHLGSWRRNADNTFKNYREIALELAEYANSLHYTHVEILGICDHPSDSSWGYQVSSYFAPNARHGSIEDFQFLVNHLHEHNLGIILDFVPYHFSGSEWGLRAFGGEKFFEKGALYNGESPGWGTRVFDLEREDVRNFLLSSAHFFLTNHVDGIRVDAVTHVITNLPTAVTHCPSTKAWSPNKEGSHWNTEGIQFLRDLNDMTHSQFPGAITHSENSKLLPYTKIDTDPIEMDGMGFDRRWNMGWRYDSMNFLNADAAQRKQLIHSLVLRFYKDWQMKQICTISHDEVAHNGSFYQQVKGSHEERLAQIRMHRSFQAFFPADGMLNMMGNEFAQAAAWDFEKELSWGLLNDPGHLGVWKTTQTVNAFYKKHPCLWSSGSSLSRFEWMAIHTQNLVIGYYRKDGKGKRLIVVHNLSMQRFEDYAFRMTHANFSANLKEMKIVFSSDWKNFGGSGAFDDITHAKIMRTSEDLPPISDVPDLSCIELVEEEDAIESQGFSIPLPPLSTVVLQEKFHKL